VPERPGGRRNGAKSRGPKTPDGKARPAQNAPKHGRRAETFLLSDEDAQEFAALQAALIDELAPDGALQRLLAERIARAAWRLERAERIEGELFDHHSGLDLVGAGNGARVFDTLLRYRGTALAELWRTLRVLKTLQAKAPAGPHEASREMPIEPEARTIPGEIVSDRTVIWLAAPWANPIEPEVGDPTASGDATGVGAAACASPIEPEVRRNPGEIEPTSVAPAHRPAQKCATLRRCAPGRRLRRGPTRRSPSEHDTDS
jgi:hypothetical protein